MIEKVHYGLETESLSKMTIRGRGGQVVFILDWRPGDHEFESPRIRLLFHTFRRLITRHLQSPLYKHMWKRDAHSIVLAHVGVRDMELEPAGVEGTNTYSYMEITFALFELPALWWGTYLFKMKSYLLEVI